MSRGSGYHQFHRPGRRDQKDPARIWGFEKNPMAPPEMQPAGKQMKEMTFDPCYSQLLQFKTLLRQPGGRCPTVPKIS
jgi:hypothetical protein